MLTVDVAAVARFLKSVSGFSGFSWMPGDGLENTFSGLLKLMVFGMIFELFMMRLTDVYLIFFEVGNIIVPDDDVLWNS